MMTRFLAVLAIALALPVAGETYEVKPVYSTIGFSIMKWNVLKEEGTFRDFNGTLVYDASHPERSRIDVVAQAASVVTKHEGRDHALRSDDFLDVSHHPTLEFHSRAIEGNVVIGDLTIHGVTKRIRFPVAALGVRDVPKVGRLAGFETNFTINRRAFGVLGNRWGAIPGVLADDVQVHIIIGAIKPDH